MPKKAAKVKPVKEIIIGPDEKIAKCIKEHENWGVLKPENRFDKSEFDAQATFDALKTASPKLLELINTIHKLDEKDMQKHGKLFKHFIYSDIKSAFGAKLIASGLASAGFTHAYKLKKTSRGMSFAIDLKDSKKQHAFATLTSVSFFEKPIGVNFRKELLSVYNKRPNNIYGEDIRIIILDSGFREGIDLFDVKYVHLFEPIATVSDETQAIGRATRFCGQKGLEFDSVYGWPLHVYRYETVIPTDIQKYIENAVPLLEPANSFFNLFMKFSNIDPKKLTFANELQRAIPEIAADRDYTRNVHTFKIPSRKHSQSAGASASASASANSLHDVYDVDDEMHEIQYEQDVDKVFQDAAIHDASQDKFTWKKAKVENLCVTPPPPPPGNAPDAQPTAQEYQIVTFGPTQEFIRSVFTPKNPLHGMLLNHSVGTGKTCSAIATASSSFEKEDYTIIYVTRYTLKPDVWKNMFGQICSVVVQEYLAKGASLPDAQAKRLRLISKKWIEPISYRQLSNMLEGKNSYHDILVKNNGKQDILQKTLIIIDEAHKLFAADVEGQEKADVDVIRKAFHHSFATSGKDAVKILMMTATPYTSDPMDMMRLLNLMRTPQKALPETFETFSEDFLDDAGKFSENGFVKFGKQLKGMISYLNRGKDIRSFAYPVFHSIKVEMSDYEYMDAIKTYHRLIKKWENMKQQLDMNISNIQTNAANYMKELKQTLRDDFDYLREQYKSCLENVKKLSPTELVKVHKTRLQDCKIYIQDCKEGLKNAYRARAEEIKENSKGIIKGLKDEMKELKKEAKREKREYDYSEIEQEIESTKAHTKVELDKLKSNESFDLSNCNTIEVYLNCVKSADSLYATQLENNKIIVEAEKAKCQVIQDELNKEMEKGNIKIKERIDAFIAREDEKLRIDKERVANAQEVYTAAYTSIVESMRNDVSQRSALDKCLTGKIPSAAKKLLKGESLVTLDDEIVTPSVHSGTKKKHNIFLINGHGSENPIQFKKRYIMPPGKALVLFPVCSRPNYMNFGCKMIEMFRDPKYKKILMNPVKYRRHISDYIGQDIRIFLPGDSVPSLSSDLFLKFEKDDKIVLAKSGVFRIDNVHDFNREILAEPGPRHSLGSPSCINQCGIINNKNDFNNAVYKEVFKDNIYSPAKRGSTYDDFSRNSHEIKTVMDTIGNGIYYYIGCRSGTHDIPLQAYASILEKSDKQQELSHRSKKIKSLVEDLIKFNETAAPQSYSSEKINSPEGPKEPGGPGGPGGPERPKEPERRKIIKLSKIQLEGLKSIVDTVTQYMEMIDKTANVPSLEELNEILEKLSTFPQATAVLKILKELEEIQYIIQYYTSGNTFTSVLRFVKTKKVIEVYVSRQIVWDRKKIYTENILQGVIPIDLKDSKLKCNAKSVMDYLKKKFKNEEPITINLPSLLEEWTATQKTRICKLVT